MGRDLNAYLIYGVVVEFGEDFFDFDNSLRISLPPDDVALGEWVQYRIKQIHDITIPEPNFPSGRDHGGRNTAAYREAMEAYRQTDEYKAYREAKDQVKDKVDSLPVKFRGFGTDACQTRVLYVEDSKQCAHWGPEEVDMENLQRTDEYQRAFEKGVEELQLEDYPQPQWLLAGEWF